MTARSIWRFAKAEPWMAIIAAVAWLGRYVSLYGHAFGAPPWTGWVDQSRYLRSAHAFFAGDLAAHQHWYPLLYPLLASPFVALNPADPFIFLDVALFAITVIAFVRIASRLGIWRIFAFPVTLAACLVQGSTAKSWLDPWTTTLSAALIWWLIERTIALDPTLAGRKLPNGRQAMLFGALAAALPLTRPVDLVASGVCVAIAGLRLGRRLSWRIVLLVGVGALAAITPYLILHLLIYGVRPTPYMLSSAQAGFVFSDLAWKMYTIVISATPWYPDTKSIVEKIPWLAFSAAGALTALATARIAKLPLLVVLAVALPYSLLMIAYSDLQPAGLWRFRNFHYFKWLLPLAGAGCLWLLGALRSWAEIRTAFGATALVATLSFVKLLPERAADDQPARMLMFTSNPARSWDNAYFSLAFITDSKGRMSNIFDFHQIPDGAVQRAIGIRRLFAAHPRRDDPDEAPAYARGQAPFARYKVRIALGLPCWIEPASCRLPP